MPTIRKAIQSDALSLSKIAERTFRDTFESVNTAENMAIHCGNSYGESIQLREIADEKMTTFLCEHEGEFIGFAQLRWGLAPECVIANSPGEIQRLYVDIQWHGKGISQELMAICFHEMRERGNDVAWLGVWEKNPRAISFYTKIGFTKVGEHVFPLGVDPQTDIVMICPITTVTLK